MKCAIVHYRVGRTDGVSLEIAKRKAVLESEGHVVRLISGPNSCGSDFVIPELEFDSFAIRQIKENCFTYFTRCDLSEGELMQQIYSVSLSIKKAILDYCSDEKFDCLFLHNIFSHGRHIAAAPALSQVTEMLKIPVIATHHDFYWERPEYQHAAYAAVDEYLRKYFPPVADNICHICINSLAAKELESRTGVKATVIGDIFDFDNPPWIEDDFNSDLLGTAGVGCCDIVILQATRIVERKAIEVAVDLADKLQERMEQLVGRALYNGKVITPQSRVVLLIAGYAEESSKEYLDQLVHYIVNKNIEVRFIGDIIGVIRDNGPKKIYSLADTYSVCDFVTYTSIQEGWGNQFLEAVYAKKPIAVFEYPVFKADIKPEGYSYISLGSKISRSEESSLLQLPEPVIERACSEIISTLLSKNTIISVNKNYNIAKSHHSVQTFLSSIFDWQVIKHLK